SVWVVLSGAHRMLRRAFAWIATFAFIVNAHWCVLSGQENLRIGYFLWWLSFLLVALVLFALSPKRPTPHRCGKPSPKSLVCHAVKFPALKCTSAITPQTQ